MGEGEDGWHGNGWQKWDKVARVGDDARSGGVDGGIA